MVAPGSSSVVPLSICTPHLFHPRPVNRIPIPFNSVSHGSISFFEMLRGRVTAAP